MIGFAFLNEHFSSGVAIVLKGGCEVDAGDQETYLGAIAVV